MPKSAPASPQAQPSLYQDAYFIDRKTGTFADALAAAGLARVLDEILQRSGGGEATIHDDANRYRVQLSRPVTAEVIDALSGEPPIAPLELVRTASNAGKLPAFMATVDYAREKTRVATYYELRRASPDLSKRAATSPGDPDVLAWQANAPRFDWSILQAINAKAGPVIVYNKVAERWSAAALADQPALLRVVLQLTASSANDETGATAAWERSRPGAATADKATETAAQLFNPYAGKGLNRPKANVLAMGNLESFWILEYLKFSGMFQFGAPRGVKGVKDRKVYVLGPATLRFDLGRLIFDHFQRTLFGETAVKMDVLAAMGLLLALLEYCTANEDEADAIFAGGRQSAVAGLYTAFYKDLGSAPAVLNLSFIALPEWMTPGSVEEVVAYKDLVERMRRLVRSIDESRAEGHHLLVVFRDFLSGRALEQLTEFCCYYGQYAIGQLVRENRPVASIREEDLERIVLSMDQNLEAIVTNPGFRNVARAIRLSTIAPQYAKARGERPAFDIRYGLGLELRRRAPYKEDFITALAEFVQTYNAENAQVAESGRQREGMRRRPSVSAADLEEVCRLLDGPRPEMVANLLIAFGYATRGRGAGEPAQGDAGGGEAGADQPDDTDADEVE